MKLINWIKKVRKDPWSIGRYEETQDDGQPAPRPKPLLNAHCEIYTVAVFYGREVLFTPNRIFRSTVPMGMRMYEIRQDEKGRPVELAHSVCGEKYGTIITHAYIPLNNGFRQIRGKRLRFKAKETSLRSFMKKHPPKKLTRQMFGA